MIDKNDKIMVLHDKISEAQNYINEMSYALENHIISDDQIEHIKFVVGDQNRILNVLNSILIDIESLD